MKVSQSKKFQELVQSQRPSDVKFIRVTSLRNCKLTAPQIRDHLNASQSTSNTHISTSTAQRRRYESGLYGQIAAKKPLRSNDKRKTTDFVQGTHVY